MPYTSFAAFFRQATGNKPYRFQDRLAEGPTLPDILNAPTGTGKTAAALLAWLWRRRFHSDPTVRSTTPRRLVYCLPMRVLVEQTLAVVSDFLGKLNLKTPVGIHVLMGGETDETWYHYPEKEAVIIGTQDMLLSRALNRGYAMSRFSWPISYGLLNNDCLWILDEIQLMGAGVPTTAQLAAFRKKIGTFGASHTLWMSATIQPDWLETVDHPSPTQTGLLQLEKDDMNEPGLFGRMNAEKMLRQLPIRQGVASKGYPGIVAQKVKELHQPGTQTLLIVNTVDRAQIIYSELTSKGIAVSSTDCEDNTPLALLLHSRFRPSERQAKVDALLEPVNPNGPGRIVVATQVVEAGVDMTSALLITEIAPWSSLVQRFGRCNRYGEYQKAAIYWIHITEAQAAPYEAADITEARHLLETMEGTSVAPANLPEHKYVKANQHVLRKKDLLELFDTTPDLSGNDIDISRFVRETGDTNLHVCWRNWPKNELLSATQLRPVRDELCPVPLWQFREYLQYTKRQAWTWDHLDRRWRRINTAEAWPGQVVILRAEEGGYDPKLGWSPASKTPVISLQPQEGIPNEASGDDLESFPGTWQTLAAHSQQTVQELQSILHTLNETMEQQLINELCLAALLHDVGKAHPVFQQTLLAGLQEEIDKVLEQGPIWAKAPRTQFRQHARPHFRHELASLLALMQQPKVGNNKTVLSDLTLYLIASHHGRIRLNIRSLPGSDGHSYSTNEPHVILGVQDGDELPVVQLDDDITVPPTCLSLQPAQMGESSEGPSWLSRALALRNNPCLGVFRLAYLEALIRAADARASKKAAKEETVDA